MKKQVLKTKDFAAPCEDMGAGHISLLFYFSSRWLSQGKELKHVYELTNKIATFLGEEGHKYTEQFYKLFLIFFHRTLRDEVEEGSLRVYACTFLLPKFHPNVPWRG